MNTQQSERAPEPPWRPILSMPDNFRRLNLDVLRYAAPSLYAQIETAMPGLEHVEVQVFGAGRIRARVDGGEPWELTPSAGEVSNFRGRVEKALALQPDLLILAGVRYGAELDCAYELAQLHPGTVFAVSASDILSILIAFSTHNRSPLLQSGVFAWSVGEPFVERLSETVNEHALYAAADAKIQLTFAIGVQDEAARQDYICAVRELIARMTPWREKLMRTLREYSDRLHQWPKELHRVWSCGKANDYTSTPILKALHRGLSSHGIEGHFTDLTGARGDRFVQHRGLISAMPDAVFTINHPTRLTVPDGAFHRFLWICDDPALRPQQRQAPEYGADEVVLYADRMFSRVLNRQGAKRIALMPEFAVLDGEGAYREELAYPIVYAGMANDLEPAVEKLNRTDRDVFEEVLAVLMTPGEGTVSAWDRWTQLDISVSLSLWVDELCRMHRREFEDVYTKLTYASYVVGTSRRRRSIVKALLPLGLHVYGGRDWRGLLGDEYKDRYHGVVAYRELADIYRSARLTINIHSAQCPTCLNIRDYDILMAGGCMLTDPVEEMGEETLAPGRDFEVAGEPEAFADAAAVLLEDESRRRSLSEAGRAMVLDRHLPKHRAGIILQALHR